MKPGFLLQKNKRDLNGTPTVAFGIRCGWWPCLRAFFLQLQFGWWHFAIWLGD